MYISQKRYSILFKAITIAIVFTFLVNDVALALDSRNPSSNSALAPTSIFNPIVILKWDSANNQYLITENEEERSRFKYDRQEDAAFVYLNLLIGQFQHDLYTLSKLGVSGRGLKEHLEEIKKDRLAKFIESIRANLPHINFDRFLFEEMYWDGNTICLPYERRDGMRSIAQDVVVEVETDHVVEREIAVRKGTVINPPDRQMLRYDLPDEKPEEPESRFMPSLDGLYQVEIPIGAGNAKIILEDPIENSDGEIGAGDEKRASGVSGLPGNVPENSITKQRLFVEAIEKGEIGATALMGQIGVSLARLSRRAQQLEARKVSRKLQNSVAVTLANKIGLGKIVSYVKSLAEANLIFGAEAAGRSFPACALGSAALVMEDRSLDNSLLIDLALAKEGYKLYANSQNSKRTAFDMETRSMLIAFAVYCTFSGEDRTQLSNYYSAKEGDAREKLSFLPLFKDIYDRAIANEKFDIETPIKDYVKRSSPGIENGEVLKLTRKELSSAGQGDTLSPYDLDFLQPTKLTPYDLSQNTEGFVYSRIIKVGYRGTSVTIGKPDEGYSSNNLLRVKYWNDLKGEGEIILKQDLDERYGKKYSLIATGGLPCYETKDLLRQLHRTCVALKSILNNEEHGEIINLLDRLNFLDEPIEVLYGNVNGPKRRSSVEFITKKSADLKRQRPMHREFAPDRKGIPASLEEVGVLLIPCSLEADGGNSRRRAEELKAAFLGMGFKDVDVGCVGTKTDSAQIIIFVEPEAADQEKMIYSVQMKYSGADIFVWSNKGGALHHRYTGRTVRGHWTTTMIMQYVAHMAEMDLCFRGPGGESRFAYPDAFIELPLATGIEDHYLDEAERPELRIEMNKLLRAAETCVETSSAYEKSIVAQGELIFKSRPSCEFVERVPRIVFENLQSVRPERGRGLSLREDDEISIRFEGSDRIWNAVVIEVDEGRVVCTTPPGLDLKKDLGKAGNIKKRYNDIPARVQLEFLRRAMEPDRGHESRFPLVDIALGLQTNAVTENENFSHEIILFNGKVGSNENQLQMVAQALNGRSIELGWGPPGTGKTQAAAAETIYQNWCMGKTQLIAAQTNKAVDNLLLKAKDMGIKVYRVGNHLGVIDPKLREDWIYRDRPKEPRESGFETKQEYGEAKRKYRDEYNKWHDAVVGDINSGRAIVGGTCMGIAMDKFLNKEVLGQYFGGDEPFAFDRCIVEEASVASFPELLLVLSKVKEKALIIGDHHQLGVSPIQPELVDMLKAASMEQKEIEAMQTSLFEFLIKQKHFTLTMLRDCYRLTQLQVKLTNFFYDGELRAMRRVSPERNRASLVVIDTKSMPRGEEQVGTSRFNEYEADLALDAIERLGRAADMDTSHLGLITPYNAQIAYFRAELKKAMLRSWPGREAYDRISRIMGNVGTVWPFQGREKPVIVISPVCSNLTGRTGFMSWKMWNVMTSRAQESMIIILNSDTFRSSPQERVPEFIGHMLKLAKEEGIYIELTPDRPQPDLSEVSAILRQTLASEYAGKLPLFTSQQGKSGRSAMLQHDPRSDAVAAKREPAPDSYGLGGNSTSLRPSPKNSPNANPEERIPDLDRERIIAIDFRDTIISRAKEAKEKGQTLILGLDESWILNLNKSCAQPIIQELERLPQNLKQLGLDNVVFERGKGDEVAIAIQKKQVETKTNFSNIIVLGAQSIISSSEFNKLKGETADDMALLIGVNVRNLTDISDTGGILEMYLLAMRLNSGRLPSELDMSFITIIPDPDGRPRAFIFEPIKPYSGEDRRTMNKIQIEQIDSKA